MTSPTGILALLAETALQNEVERVGAAVGVRVVHVGASAPVSRKTWSAADAVLCDETTARHCGQLGLPRRTHVVVLTSAEPTATTWQAAIAIGAQRVLRLPTQDRELITELTEAGESAGERVHRGDVLAVIGGRGGAGASLFAAALALAARTALLVDLDPWGGGIDLLLGSENAAGLRWPDLALEGGRVDWSSLRAALPRHRGISVISGTRREYQLGAPAVAAVVNAGRRGGVTVVCDLPRCLTAAGEAALDTADLAVVVTPGDVRACAATATIAPALLTVNSQVGLVVRGPAPGGLRATEIAGIVGLPLLAVMRAEPRLADQLEHHGLRLRRRSALAAAARRVLAVLPDRPAARPAQQGRAA